MNTLSIDIVQINARGFPLPEDEATRQRAKQVEDRFPKAVTQIMPGDSWIFVVSKYPLYRRIKEFVLGTDETPKPA